jgi:hypothetical protein
LSEKTEAPSAETLEWAARVWKRLTQLQCAGLLQIALRYSQHQQHTSDYIASMSMLTWLQLGRPLQLDVARALSQLRDVFNAAR